MEDLKKQFVSVLASQFVKMIEEKRAFGYKYEELGVFRRLDRFLVEHNLKKIALPQSMVELWVKRRNFELSRTLGNRISAVRLLAEFLIRQGIPAYYPDKYSTEKIVYNFTPYIFSHAEITSLIKNSDELRQIMKNHPYSWKYRHFSVVIRLLYSTGLRSGEARNLHWKNVDFDSGVIKIIQGKFNKDRFVPLTPQMFRCLKEFRSQCRQSDKHVFADPNGNQTSTTSFYKTFRNVLAAAGIQHKGRGKGPRLHDLRHTFAVHNLEKWLNAKEDIRAKLFILSDYLGHENLSGTQKYLRLTPSVFPEIASRMEESVGTMIRELQK